jgi:undecaprenyl-diphosphatase
MDWTEGIALGVVQGFTEFLPVSSSGHLVLAQALLGVRVPGILLEVTVHAATLLAVLLYFRKRLLALALSLRALARWRSAAEEEREGVRTMAALALATLPAAVAGLAFKDAVESAFEDPRLVCALLAATGVGLLATRFAPAPGAATTPPRALAVGCAQALALLPGISRSGSTIAAALFLRIEGARAAEFSLLLSIPAVGGALLLEGREIAAVEHAGPLAAAFAAAFLSGLLAIALLFRVLQRRSFWLFGVYCLAAGAAGFAALSLR